MKNLLIVLICLAGCSEQDLHPRVCRIASVSPDGNRTRLSCPEGEKFIDYWVGNVGDSIHVDDRFWFF